MTVHVLASKDELEKAVGDFIVERYSAALGGHGNFTVAFSGGSSATVACASLLKQADIEWNKWRVFLCDERYVPLDDADSNYQAIYGGLFSKVCDKNCLAKNLFPINPTLSLVDAAKDYTKKLESVFGTSPFPKFDLLLLGMGPDGHICSLFPGHPLLGEEKLWVAHIDDSPKPPPQRVTLTFPVVNNAHCQVFIAFGESKAPMIKRIVQDKDMSLPATRVSGNVHWFLDKAAASLLDKGVTQ